MVIDAFKRKKLKWLYFELDDLAQNQGVDKIVTLVDSRRPSRSKQAQALDV